MKFRLGFLPEADRDLLDAIAWYASQKKGLGRKFASAVRQVLKLMRVMPRIHGFACADVRRAPVKGFPYLILYRIMSADVVVVGVSHPKRGTNDGQTRR